MENIKEALPTCAGCWPTTGAMWRWPVASYNAGEGTVWTAGRGVPRTRKPRLTSDASSNSSRGRNIPSMRDS